MFCIAQQISRIYSSCITATLYSWINNLSYLLPHVLCFYGLDHSRFLIYKYIHEDIYINVINRILLCNKFCFKWSCEKTFKNNIYNILHLFTYLLFLIFFRSAFPSVFNSLNLEWVNIFSKFKFADDKFLKFYIIFAFLNSNAKLAVVYHCSLMCNVLFSLAVFKIFTLSFIINYIIAVPKCVFSFIVESEILWFW